MPLRSVATLAAAAAALAASAATAHEVLLRPVPLAGSTRVIVESTHVFAKPEEREDVAALRAGLVTAAGMTEVGLAPEGDLSLAADVAVPAGGAWVVAHRLPQVWSNTPGGFKPGSRAEHKDAIFTNRYEKFAKAYIAGTDPSLATEPLGQGLEIVPVGDLSGLKAGDALAVRVLHDGRPVPATVMATFDGFSDRPMTFAYATETSEEPGETGLATLKLWQSGLWFVRVALETEDPAADVDTHVLRAVLSFPVK